MKLPGTLMLYFVFFNAIAQSYSIKKGELFKDKEKIGTLKGEVGFVKMIDLSFINAAGAPILMVTEHSFEVAYPNVEPIRWLKFNFPREFVELIIKINESYINEKQFIKYQFTNRGIALYPEGFKWEEMVSLRKEDYANELQQDTLKILAEINFYQTVLSKGKIDRDYTKDATFRPVPMMQDMYWINQGVNLKSEPYEIGRLAIVTTTEIMGKVKREIVIMKRLLEPVERDGDNVEFIEAGHIEIGSFPYLFTYQDGVKHRDINFNSTETIEEMYTRAVKYMIVREYL